MNSLTTAFEAPVCTPEELRVTITELLSQLESIHDHNNDPLNPLTPSPQHIPQLVIDQIINLLNNMAKNGLVEDPLYDLKESAAPLIEYLLQKQLEITPPATQLYTTTILLVKLAPILQKIDFCTDGLAKLGLKGLDLTTQSPVYPTHTNSALANQLSDPKLYE